MLCFTLKCNDRESWTVGTYKRILHENSPSTIATNRHLKRSKMHTDQANKQHSDDTRARGLMLMYVKNFGPSIYTTFSQRLPVIVPAQIQLTLLRSRSTSNGFGAIYLQLAHSLRREQSMQYAVPVGRVYAGCTLSGKYLSPRLRHYRAKASPIMSR